MNSVEPNALGLFSETTTATHSTGGPGPVHVWLVDDHAVVRNLIAETLERAGGIVCTRQFDSPNSLLSALASRIGPDVILLDVQMGEHNGLDAIPAIKSLARDTRVLMLTTCYDPEWHERALEAGASDFLLKTNPVQKLTQSICRNDEAPVRRVPGKILRQRAASRRRQRGELVELDELVRKAREKSSPGQSPSLFGWLRKFTRN